MPSLPERTQEPPASSRATTRPAPSSAEADSWFDRLLIALMSNVPGWAVGLTAAAIYGVFGLALPFAFGYPVITFALWNLAATLFAGLVLLAYLNTRIRQLERRHLVEWTTDLRLLSGAEFEWLVGELYRRKGYAVIERGRQDAADGGIDLELTKGRDRRYVQCKRWQAWWVGVEHVRAFAGTLLREKADGKSGIFVTLSTFTTEAVREAQRVGIELVDGRLLYQFVEAARRPEACPKCGRSMLLDRSTHGWWFRCVAPSCGGKRDLDADPARAVDLLTEPPTAGQL